MLFSLSHLHNNNNWSSVNASNLSDEGKLDAKAEALLRSGINVEITLYKLVQQIFNRRIQSMYVISSTP